MCICLHDLACIGCIFLVRAQVNWQRFQFRLGFTSREGAVLHEVGYADEGSGALAGTGRIRPIAYRMSFVGAFLLLAVHIRYGTVSHR